MSEFQSPCAVQLAHWETRRAQGQIHREQFRSTFPELPIQVHLSLMEINNLISMLLTHYLLQKVPVTSPWVRSQSFMS